MAPIAKATKPTNKDLDLDVGNTAYKMRLHLLLYTCHLLLALSVAGVLWHARAPSKRSMAVTDSVLCSQQQRSKMQLSARTADTPQQHVPQMLSHMLVCITFKWIPEKLVYLRTVLQAVGTYRTNVDTLIVTDQAKVLSKALEGMAHLAALQCVGVWEPQMREGRDKYWLTYQHRQAIEHKLKEKDYSTVLYLEDDTYISWPAVVSWALDTELLQPFNLTRCFYRTEIHQKAGTKVLLDYVRKQSVATLKGIDVKSLGAATSAAYDILFQQLRGRLCGEHLDGYQQPCHDSLHNLFFSPETPFQGMWILNKQQLQAFMEHAYWTQNASVTANLGRYHWGYPERSNSINLFLNVPSGYDSNCMVPYVLASASTSDAAEPVLHSATKQGQYGYLTEWLLDVGASNATLPQLPAVAEVVHLRNGYGTQDCIPDRKQMAKCVNALASIPVDEAFID